MSDETKIPNLRAVRMEADAAFARQPVRIADEAALSGQVAGQYEIQETGELVSWNGTTITARGPALAPLTRVLQLEDEIIANLVPDYVWGAPSQPVTQNPEILNAALELGMTTGKPVRVKAGTYWMPRTVKPTADTWRRCELYGAGAAHPQSIGRNVITKAGTVFIGNNNTILEIDFLDIANETVQITGIGFLNDVDTPAFGLPPIILRKKNPRYISGHKIDISLYNWSAGLTWVGANSTVSANYVGPMELTVNKLPCSQTDTIFRRDSEQVYYLQLTLA